MKRLKLLKDIQLHTVFLLLACVSALLSIYLVEHYISYISEGDKLLSLSGSIFLGVLNFVMTYRVFNSKGLPRLTALVILLASMGVSITLIYSWLNAGEDAQYQAMKMDRNQRSDKQQSVLFDNYQKNIALNNQQIDQLQSLNQTTLNEIKGYEKLIKQGVRPKNNQANKRVLAREINQRNKTLIELQKLNQTLLKQQPQPIITKLIATNNNVLSTLKAINKVNLALASLFELFIILFHLVAHWFKKDRQTQAKKQRIVLQDLLNQVNLKEKQLKQYLDSSDQANKAAQALKGKLHVQTERAQEAHNNLTNVDELAYTITQEVEDAVLAASRLTKIIEQAHRAEQRLTDPEARYDGTMSSLKQHDGATSSRVAPVVPPVVPSSRHSEEEKIHLKDYLHYFKNRKIKATAAGNIIDKTITKKTKLTFEQARSLREMAYQYNILTRKPSGSGHTYQYNDVYPSTQRDIPLSLVK